MSVRKFKRRHLIYYLRVYDHATGELIGHMADITTDGIMLISEKPIETGKSFSLKMTLPEELEGTRVVSLSATSVWCKKDVNPDFYAIGFKIDDIDDKELEVIDVLIDSFGFRD